MKLRIEMHWLAVVLLALIVMVLWTPAAQVDKQQVITVREESEIEKFRRKRGTGDNGLFSGRGRAPQRKRQTLEEEIEAKDAEVCRVVTGHVTGRA